MTARPERINRNARYMYFHSLSFLQTTKLRSADFSKKNPDERAYARIASAARIIGDLHFLEMRLLRHGHDRVDTNRVFWMPFRCCWGGGGGGHKPYQGLRGAYRV